MSQEDDQTNRLVRDHAERCLRGQLFDRGVDANRILNQIHRGSSIATLEPLFAADNLECTKTLTFILSELGERSVEAMAWLEILLDHPDDWVRHYAIVAVQRSGSLVHGAIIAKAISKLRDIRSVELAAVQLLAMGSIVQIDTAVPYLDAELADAVSWLVRGDLELWEEMSAYGGTRSLVAVAAAYRLGWEGNSAPLTALVADPRHQVADAANFVEGRHPLPLANRDILHRMARPVDD